MNTTAQNINAILTNSGNYSGLLIPAYIQPPSAAFDKIIAQMQANPNVPVAIIINPDNGPDKTVDPTYTALVQQFQAMGGIILAYIHSKNAKTPEATMQATVDTWLKEYKVDGIFIDEMDTKPADAPYYVTLMAYIKSKGLKLVVGNPGTNPDTSYFSTKTADIIVVEELDGSWPTAAEIKEGIQAQRATIATSVTFDATQFAAQYKACRLVWATDQNNQYNNIPSDAFLASMFAALSAFNGNTVPSGNGSASSASGSGTGSNPPIPTQGRRKVVDRRKVVA